MSADAQAVQARASAAVDAAHATLMRAFDAQRAAFAREPYPTLSVRRDRLERIRAIVSRHEADFVAAVDADFGHRSAHETRLAELYIVAAEAKHAIGHLQRWMRPERVPTPLHLRPARARVERQPVGVAGVVSPWNYPVQLALAPAIGALAAGCRVMLKPSEFTPRTSALLRELVAATFGADEFIVIEGGADVGRMFTSLPFDHLFFTGSTAVGRHVARAAAEHLTPVTLELGGKSPALFDDGADFALASPRLVVGKLLNAGQTCIAPDYAVVPAARLDEFVAAVRAAAAQLYPSYAGNPDYTSIVNDHHYQRLTALVADARAKGATIIELGAGDAAARVFAPTLVVGARDDMAVMQEEIFGPLLPIEGHRGLDDAIARVNARPHPLAFYFFGPDAARRERALRETRAGGVTVNDTLWHFAHDNLPFGGIGPSGSGAYHGEASFLTFTHRKAVLLQPRFAAARLLYPPYGQRFEKVLALLKRLNG